MNQVSSTEIADKFLIANSTRHFEMDDEEMKSIEERTSNQYNGLLIIESIGTDEFKSIYLNFINAIKKLSISTQQTLCIQILDKIEEVYDWTFPFNFTFDNQRQINRLYNFLQFIEYDHISFLTKLWFYLNVDLKHIDIEKYCLENINKVMIEIDEIAEISGLSEMITIFIRTYDKRKMIKFISGNSVKNKSMIILNLLEGEKSNE